MNPTALTHPERIRAHFQEIKKKYGVKKSELTSHSRKPHLVRARDELVKLLRNDPFLAMSFPRIAEILGGRDHTSIIHLYYRKQSK